MAIFKTSAEDEDVLNHLNTLKNPKVKHNDNTNEQNLHLFLKKVAHWNKGFNLVGNAHSEYLNHICLSQCLELAHFLSSKVLKISGQEFKPFKLIDVGSGAGFPGMVLALSLPAKHPNLKITLLEQSLKKSQFLKHLITHFQLQTHCQSVSNDLKSHLNTHSNLYDLIVSRAVFSDAEKWYKLAKRAVKPKGLVVNMLSSQQSSAFEKIALNQGLFIHSKCHFCPEKENANPWDLLVCQKI